MHLQPHEQHKMSKQSIPVCFMGVVDYSMSTYCVYVVSQCRVVDTHNIVFDEHCASWPPDDCQQPMQQAIYVLLLADDNSDTLLAALPFQDMDSGMPAAVSPTEPDSGSSSPLGLTMLNLVSSPSHTTEISGMVLELLPLVFLEVSQVEPPVCKAPALAALKLPVCTLAGTQIVGSACGSTTTSCKQVEWVAAASAKHGGDTVVVT